MKYYLSYMLDSTIDSQSNMTISPEVLKQLTEIIQKVRSEEKSSVLIIVQVSQILLELEKADRQREEVNMLSTIKKASLEASPKVSPKVQEALEASQAPNNQKAYRKFFLVDEGSKYIQYTPIKRLEEYLPANTPIIQVNQYKNGMRTYKHIAFQSRVEESKGQLNAGQKAEQEGPMFCTPPSKKQEERSRE